MSEIEVERLTKRYGETLAVDDLSFTVEAGRVTGFLGPNGAGKSTTLRALLGLIRPTSGQALVLGRPFVELADPARTVGASLDASDVHPGRTGRSHLRTLAAAAGLPTSRVDEVLDMTELTPARDRRVKGYSMGMRQRLALAAALLGDPKILMLDEPANGLDPQGMRWLRDILVALAAEGRAVLISSHVLSEVEQTVDSVVVIGAGRLVMQGSLQDLVAGDQRPALVRSPQRDELRDAARGRRRDRDARRARRHDARAPRLARADRHSRRRAPDPRVRAHARRGHARGPLPRAHRRERQRAMRILRSEWLKVVSVPTTWILLGVDAADRGPCRGPRDRRRRHRGPAHAPTRATLLIGTPLSTVLIFTLGALLATNEYRHGTANQTFIITPQRERVIAAKLAVGLVVGIVGALLYITVNAGLGLSILSNRGVDVDGDLAVNIYSGVGVGDRPRLPVRRRARRAAAQPGAHDRHRPRAVPRARRGRAVHRQRRRQVLPRRGAAGAAGHAEPTRTCSARSTAASCSPRRASWWRSPGSTSRATREIN